MEMRVVLLADGAASGPSFPFFFFFSFSLGLCVGVGVDAGKRRVSCVGERALASNVQEVWTAC